MKALYRVAECSPEKLLQHSGGSLWYGFVRIEVCAYLQGFVD